MPTENNAFHHPDLLPAHDFIRKRDEREYAKTYASLMIELSPEGTLEKTFATEIMGCTWRLRRCRIIESDLVGPSDTDPMIYGEATDETTGRTQKTVDRARAQSHYLLRRSISELRTLQTERTIRLQLQVQEDITGVTNTSQVLRTVKMDAAPNDPKPAAKGQEDTTVQGLENLMALADKQVAQQYRDSSKLDFPGLIPNDADPKTQAPCVTEEEMARPYPSSDHSEDQQPPVGASFCKPEESESGVGAGACPDRDREAERSSARYPNSGRSEDQEPLVRGSFCKPDATTPAIPKTTPRNAPCPCGSGRKYKRCHGGPNA